MGQSMVYNSNNYGNYTERIRYLRSTNEHLLQKIQCLESNLNKRKQQNKEPFYHDINELQCLVTKSLQSLAEINVCQFFHMINEYYDANDYYYKQMCRKYFDDLMQQATSNITNQIKAKRINQIKRNLIDQNDNNNDDDDDIDFSISR